MGARFQVPDDGMRREQFTLDVTDVAWIDGDADPEMPCLKIAYDGDPEELATGLEDAYGERLDADEIDVTVRLQGDIGSDDAHGIIAMTSRVTGDYLLETRISAPDIVTFTRAARRFGDHTEGTSRYRISLLVDGEISAEYEKRTLLVYSEDGDLLRHHSLIPSGVEI